MWPVYHYCKEWVGQFMPSLITKSHSNCCHNMPTMSIMSCHISTPIWQDRMLNVDKFTLNVSVTFILSSPILPQNLHIHHAPLSLHPTMAIGSFTNLMDDQHKLCRLFLGFSPSNVFHPQSCLCWLNLVWLWK